MRPESKLSWLRLKTRRTIACIYLSRKHGLSDESGTLEKAGLSCYNSLFKPPQSYEPKSPYFGDPPDGISTPGACQQFTRGYHRGDPVPIRTFWTF